MPVILREPHEPLRAVAHLRDRPGRAGRVGILDGLDGVDREHVGAQRRRRARSTAGSDVSRDEEHARRERAEPVGAQPHLRRRLLRAHEQAPGAARGHRAERLEQQRALAHARLAADAA